MKPEFPYFFSGGEPGGPVSNRQRANNTRLISEHLAMPGDAHVADGVPVLPARSTVAAGRRKSANCEGIAFSPACIPYRAVEVSRVVVSYRRWRSSGSEPRDWETLRNTTAARKPASFPGGLIRLDSMPHIQGVTTITEPGRHWLERKEKAEW